MYSVKNHCLVSARQVPSPNFNERPDSIAVDLIVLHSISLPPGIYSGSSIEALFTNCLNSAEHPYFATIADLKVSAHLLIRRCGEVVQFVPFDKRAWHAGVSSYHGRTNCNDFSIGIELEGTDTDVFTAEQYKQLAMAIVCLCDAYPALSVHRVVGHEHIAPGRKTDPGSGFDWQQLHTLLSNLSNQT